MSWRSTCVYVSWGPGVLLASGAPTQTRGLGREEAAKESLWGRGFYGSNQAPKARSSAPCFYNCCSV